MISKPGSLSQRTARKITGRQVKRCSSLSLHLMMRVFSWPIPAASKHHHGLHSVPKVNGDSTDVTGCTLYLGSRWKLETSAVSRKTRSQQPECDTSGGAEAEPTALFALPRRITDDKLCLKQEPLSRVSMPIKQPRSCKFHRSCRALAFSGPK